MEELTVPSRMHMFVNNILDALTHRKKLPTKMSLEQELNQEQRRTRERKDFPYYMALINHDTQELVGHLTDISSRGFKLDSENPISLNKEFRLRMDLTSEVAEKPSMIFVARSRWCKVDPYDPFCFNVGFQLTEIAPEDLEIFNRMIEKYGAEFEYKRIDLRRTNLW